MEQTIQLPVTYTVMSDGKPITVTENVTTTLYNNERDDEKLISSMTYVPDFQQDAPIFKDATKLLDYLISDTDDETIRVIYEAYCDTLYKWSAYHKLSYGAKLAYLKEKGFDYVLDLLLHMYDDEYSELESIYKSLINGAVIEDIPYGITIDGDNISIITYDEFVRYKADDKLTRLVSLFNLINALKGKTLGLELVLQLVDMPDYLYLPWNIIADYKGEWEEDISKLPTPGSGEEVHAGDCYSLTKGDTVNYYIFNGVAWHQCDIYTNYTTKREPITAILEVYGASNTDLQKRLATFVRSYMLPLIDVTLRFTAKFPTVWCYPSGIYDVYKMFSVWDYYDKQGTHYQKDLTNIVSEECWYYSAMYPREDIFFGVPAKDIAYQGSVNLAKSYYEDRDGVKHYLYGSDPTINENIVGTALDKITQEGTITDYQGTFVQVPLENYVEIDIVTGEQQNPHYEDDEFIRDRLIAYYRCLTIGGIHLNMTVEEIEQLLIEDFEKEYSEYEVYLGKSTTIEATSGRSYVEDFDAYIDERVEEYIDTLIDDSHVPENTIYEFAETYKILKNPESSYYQKFRAESKIKSLLAQYPALSILTEYTSFYDFEYSEPTIRANTGKENHHLVFCEEGLDTNYCGIGDLGILGANDYFIYNGMLMYHGDILKQVGEDKTWTDVGASHAVSETYYTPAINDGKLCYVYKGEVGSIERDMNHLANYTNFIVKHPQILVENMDLDLSVETIDEELVRSFVEAWAEIGEYWDKVEADGWTHITGYINDFYTAFGICDGRLYKLYKNPLYGNIREDGTEEPFMVYQIIDDDTEWTYLTGAAYSETYEAYGIKNEKLYRISADEITEIKWTDLEKITGIENVTYADNTVTYNTLIGQDTIKIESHVYTHYDEYETEDGTDVYEWDETIVDKILFNGLEQDFTQEGSLYTTENLEITFYDTIQNINVETKDYICVINFENDSPSSFVLTQNEEIVGWKSDFDCISRYHHCNNDYTTYGICDGDLYSITNETIKILDDTKIWTAICGYYNSNSPRTFAYAISNGILYELEDDEIRVKDDTMYWTQIHGCTTATNNFVLGLAKHNSEDSSGYVYKINAKILSKITDEGGWTDTFGRYTTSTAVSNQCYGYGVKNNKLYQFTKDGISIISGFWKEESTGAIVDLRDFNIENIKTNLPDGTVLNSIQEIKEGVPFADTVLSDYDIYITYTTKGFENNHRYIVRTEVTESNYTYDNPEACRKNVSEANCKGLFDNNTGLMDGFISENVTVHGTHIIDGYGVAYGFKNENTYLELPTLRNTLDIILTFEITCEDNSIYPVSVAEDGTGIYYGYHSGKYGILAKSNTGYTNICELRQNEEKKVTIKYTVNGGHTDLYLNNTTYSRVFTSTNSNYINLPVYLGGDGTSFGNSTIYLIDSKIVGRDNTLPLYENGKYFSFKSQTEDVVLDVITNDVQGTQNVLEITKENGEKLEYTMDILYTMMQPECTIGDLSVSTDYNIDKIRSEEYEGVSYATLNYVGAYQLDPEKITSRKPLGTDFDMTGIASNLQVGEVNFFKLSTDVNTPIQITTGKNVNSQYLYSTEENDAYTNRYLLKSTVEASTDLDCRAVPSGIIYEVNSDAPRVVTRTLTYNNDTFNLDTDKVFTEGENYYNFDSYNAQLNYYPASEYDTETGEFVYKDNYTNILLPFEGDRTSTSFVATAKFKINSNEEEQEFLRIDDNSYDTLGAGNYIYKLDIDRQFISLNNDWLDEINPETTEPKDKLIYQDGQCWNYSKQAYQVFKNLLNNRGLILYVITDDDTSKDQGIFGSFDKAAFGIKDNHWCYTDANGIVHKSDKVTRDMAKQFIKFNFETNTISIAPDLEQWEVLFEDAVFYNNATLGCANVEGEKLAFNGTVDLAKSFLLDSKERLYKMTQETKISVSEDDETWTLIETLNTAYSIEEILVGFHFNGSLDCYYSKLLRDYELGWVDSYMKVDDYIKSVLRSKDPSYNPDLDENTYTIKEYGIYLNEEPKRWDSIVVTYTTVDKAVYLRPNTEYTTWIETEEDREGGKAIINTSGELIWNDATVSGFENGYCSYNLSNEDYIVLKLNMTDVDQAILGYTDTISQAIFVRDGKVKYFDDINTHDLFNAQSCYLKLYTSSHDIEYSLDGNTYISTGVSASFSGYDTLLIGTGYVNGELDYFKGSIDLKESYIMAGDKLTSLFRHYKKVYPYISDGVNTYPLTLEPLLTVNDYVTFCKVFNGSVDMYHSGLCLPDTKYWEGNQIKIYDGNGLLRDTIIRDDIEVDPSYTKETTLVRVNPVELECYFPETPKIGDQIILTYNTWYLFREKNTEYNFLITNNNGTATLSYKKVGENEPEYLVYITNNQNFTVNFGYHFGGTLNVYGSTRGGMHLCDYHEWYTYLIKFRKYESDIWETWCEFVLERNEAMQQRIGYELSGTHYLASSWFSTRKVTAPFVSFYNNEYIYPVGGVSFATDQSGIVSGFSEDAYLAAVMEKMEDGGTLSFFITTGDNEDQGLCTFVKGKDGRFITIDEDVQLNKFRPNYNYIVQYIFGGYGITVHDVDVMPVSSLEKTLIKMFSSGENQVVVRILGYNIGDISYTPTKSKLHYVTVIPFNPNKAEGATGQYITTPEQASRVKITYRKVENAYDHFTEEGIDAWYSAELEPMMIDYFGNRLQVYAAKVPFGYSFSSAGDINYNENIEYYVGDEIEFRIDSNITTYTTIIPYNNKMLKQRAIF